MYAHMHTQIKMKGTLPGKGYLWWLHQQHVFRKKIKQSLLLGWYLWEWQVGNITALNHSFLRLSWWLYFNIFCVHLKAADGWKKSLRCSFFLDYEIISKCKVYICVQIYSFFLNDSVDLFNFSAVQAIKCVLDRGNANFIFVYRWWQLENVRAEMKLSHITWLREVPSVTMNRLNCCLSLPTLLYSTRIHQNWRLEKMSFSDHFMRCLSLSFLLSGDYDHKSLCAVFTFVHWIILETSITAFLS